MCLYLCYFILEFSGVAEKNTICSFYDFDSLNWSNKGCSKNLENSGWYYCNISSTEIPIVYSKLTKYKV